MTSAAHDEQHATTVIPGLAVRVAIAERVGMAQRTVLRCYQHKGSLSRRLHRLVTEAAMELCVPLPPPPPPDAMPERIPYAATKKERAAIAARIGADVRSVTRHYKQDRMSRGTHELIVIAALEMNIAPPPPFPERAR